MATESVIATQQPTSSSSQTLIYATSTSEKIAATAASNSADTKSDTEFDKTSRNSSSCDEESTDEGGKLVIDLGNENDVDKSTKDTMKGFAGSQSRGSGRETPIRNNNNNNSTTSTVSNSSKFSSSANEKTSSSNRNVSSSGVSKALSSFSQSAALVHSCKSSKSKNKKSSKTNKTHASAHPTNSLPHSSTSRTSSPSIPFNGVADITANVNSGKHAHSFDSKSTLPRTSNSPDDVTGKKSKSSKSKSHHKKHSKHGEKSNSANGTSKSDAPGEKLKTKSKHSNIVEPNNSVSSMTAFSTSSGAHVLPALVSSSSSHLAVASKTTFHRSASPKLGSLAGTQPLLNPLKTNQLAQGRTPTRTALGHTATGNGAKINQACNEKDCATSEANQSSINQAVPSRKKHRKGQSGSVINNSVSQPSLVNSRDLADSTHHKSYSNQQANIGKRDRSNLASNLPLPTNDVAGSKKPKLDVDGKIGNSPRSSSSSSEINLRPGSQFTCSNTGENKTSSTPNKKALSPNNQACSDTGELSHCSTANKPSDSGVIFASPPVFAPSSIFAHTMPRFSASSSGEYANSSMTSVPETSSVWSSAGNYNVCDGSRSSSKSGPPVVNSQRSVGTLTCTSDIGVMTEPDALGPCEPGTSVHLDGIVWHETDTGVLVVNVTWRNRTYVGTLLDATKHDWAPPRFSENDLEMELRAKNGRPKRARGGVADATRKGRSRGGAAQSIADDVKGSPSTAAKRRNKNSESETANNTDNDGASTPRSSKRARLANSRATKDITQQLQQLQSERNTNGSNGGSGSSTCSSPVFFDCPHPKCSKRYKHINGLKYHQAHAHGDDSDAKDSSDPKDDDRMSSDHAKLTPDEDSRLSDSELATSLEEEDLKKVVHKEESSTKSPSPNPPKSLENVQLSLKEEDIDSFPKSSTELEFAVARGNEIKISPNVNSTVSNSTLSEVKVSFPSTSARPVAVFPSIGAVSSSDPNIPHSSTKTLPSTVNSAVYASLPSTAAAGRQHPLLPERNAADNESAQAVKTLLQLQGPEEQFLPGLSAPYSQDSPHPTLSLVARSGQGSVQDNVSVSAGYPNPSVLRPPLATDPVLNKSLASTFPSSMSYPSQANPVLPLLSAEARPIPEFSAHPPMRMDQPHHTTDCSGSFAASSIITATMPVVSGREHFSETMQRFPTPSIHKDTYMASVSTPVSFPQGTKMAKGKTVPVPVDPNYSLPSSYAGAASPASLSAKKLKRKKKLDGKPGPITPGGESDSRGSEGFMPSQVQPITSLTPEVSNALLTASAFTTGAPALSSMAVSMPNAHKPQNAVQKSNDSTTSTISIAHVKAEPGLRLPPHHVGGRKIPGIVMCATSSQNQSSNNITVTGTFHPHPDPHKPQTAVSAQAQDRIRANRVSSPTNSSSSSSNRNNNNKFAEMQANTAAGRTQLQQRQLEQPNTKPRLQSTQVASPNTEQPAHQEPEPPLPTNPRYSEPKVRPVQPEHAISKMQSNAESAIASVYGDVTSREKPSTPAPTEPQKQLEPPAPSRPQPPSREPRPVIINEEAPSRSVQGTPSNRVRVAQDAVAEVRGSSPSSQAKTSSGEVSLVNNPQATYMPQFQQLYPGAHPAMFQLGLSGMGYIPSMDPAFQHAQFLSGPRLRQYEQIMQEVQKQNYLQQLSQQQGDKKIRKPEASGKEISKHDYSSKPIPQSLVEQERPPTWPHQQNKRPSTGTSSPVHLQNVKDKPSGNVLQPSPHQQVLSQHARYKSPQPNSIASTPARCHSVAAVSPANPLTSSLHVRSESLDRGKPTTREEVRPNMRKPTTPPVRTEKSPEKPKEGVPASVSAYRSPAASPAGQLPFYSAYPQIYDPSRAASFRAVPQFATYPAGYVFPSSGASPMFPAQGRWPTGAPTPGEKPSPPPLKSTKDLPPNRPRSPPRDELSKARFAEKAREPPVVHYGMKDRRSREVQHLPLQKLSASPDPKAVVPVTAQPARHSVGGPPPSVDQRPPSPPTQRHHHTHHHIHEGVLPFPPHYPIQPSPVIASADGVAGYSLPYPKRD